VPVQASKFLNFLDTPPGGFYVRAFREQPFTLSEVQAYSRLAHIREGRSIVGAQFIAPDFPSTKVPAIRVPKYPVTTPPLPLDYEHGAF
jgi:hypothetical protein